MLTIEAGGLSSDPLADLVLTFLASTRRCNPAKPFD